MKITIGAITDSERIEIGRTITNGPDGTTGVEVTLTPDDNVDGDEAADHDRRSTRH